MREGSWFDESKLGMLEILLMTYMWCIKMSHECIELVPKFLAAVKKVYGPQTHD